MSRKRPVTTNDVAARAGVSRATVSVVLNNARSTVRVSKSTRERIEGIAAELGYSPNRAAQALRRRQSGVIAFVPMAVKELYRPFDLPVQFLIGSYVSRAALNHGFHAIEVPVEIAASGESQDLIRFLSTLDVDGVIFHGADNPSHIQAVTDLGVPIVDLMRPWAEAHSLTVTVDPAPGIASAVDHLSRLGHRLIGFVGTASSHPNDTARKECFIHQLHHRGIGIPREYIRESGRYSVEDGCLNARYLLSLPTPPTAIFAAGDILSLGVLHALYESGVRVPDDLTLVSYDDAIVDNLYPPLTSVSQPFQKVAERAVSLIAERVGDSESVFADLDHIVYPSQLVVRASSASPKRGGVLTTLEARTE